MITFSVTLIICSSTHSIIYPDFSSRALHHSFIFLHSHYTHSLTHLFLHIQTQACTLRFNPPSSRQAKIFPCIAATWKFWVLCGIPDRRDVYMHSNILHHLQQECHRMYWDLWLCRGHQSPGLQLVHNHLEVDSTQRHSMTWQCPQQNMPQLQIHWQLHPVYNNYYSTCSQN